PGTFLWSFGLSSGVDEVGEVISQDLSIALAITIPEPATGLAALALLPVLARRRRHAGRGCR
ncbi:MAG: GlyGly-CTERM sorting domain-containing protein, partial [Planctomycetota bacterium]